MIWNQLGTTSFNLGQFQCAKEFLDCLLIRFTNTMREKSLTKFSASLNCQACGLNELSTAYEGMLSLYVGQSDVSDLLDKCKLLDGSKL